MELTHRTEGYRLQPRINLRRDLEPILTETATTTTNVITRILTRDSDKCKESPNSNTCEKPVSASTTLIVVVVVVPCVLLAGLLFYLHRRNVQRQQLEDIHDPHKSLDFGLGEGKKNRKSLFMGGGGEKGMSHKQSQLSMDMNLSSPYLLPPGLQQSHESLHSLARSLGNDHQDPYQQATIYTNSETGSMRSMPYSKESSSLYTKSSGKRMSGTTGRSVPSQRMPPRTNSLPKSPTSPEDVKINPFAIPSIPEPAHKLQSPVEADSGTFQPKAIIPEIGNVSDFDDKYNTAVQQPQPARSKSPQFELPAVSDAGNSNAGTPVADGFPLPPHRGGESNAIGLGLDFQLPKAPVSPGHEAPLSAPLPMHGQQHNDSQFNAYQPEIHTSEYYDDYEDFDRGRSAQRASFVEDAPQQQGQGLGVPQQNNKRLSVGFRPLPPDEVTESEDPEYRANRIRSFYKEYFEESKEPPPPMPAPPKAAQGGYYEDYDQGYLGEAAAYFDPESNAFVMPYAEPVTRRAMTPPPAGRRQFGGGPGGPGGPGPRGPGGSRPHGPHGSLGGMSLPGGPQGRPRAGSAFGPHGGSRAGSRAGSAFGPRPDSSASARSRGQPRKNLPPPAPLTTLPTPSKLKDDAFALLGVMDFAPPGTFKDAAAGRSQSPLGERRAYSPQVPAVTPVVSAFEELAALPSPHLLRKSSTFTGLDFAPPKKFKDADNMSDAGSIRSNRSGISAAQLGAIRGGAGRVSRLPGDTVFTQASVENQLKPQWGMRQ
ncbi:hypothetical protein AK830_g3211 [Neonectria ditissima]|uniref:Uncharacterized protein n=1 Tax=Neonectria ditissima TaxID=78410 RepID=A0A0P7BQN2_9HYPO|nr:hypothetical protein AK830_g3211 [Neonectria ditissima]